MIPRDLNIDFMRIVAAFAVVWLHVSAPVVAGNPDVQSYAWWIGNIADSFSRWCVPLFVMVSGALLLSRKPDLIPFKFYGRAFKRVLPPIMFWTFVYLFIQYYTNKIDAKAAVNMIISGHPYYHLWYLYMLLGLYLVTPFIRYIIAASTPQIVHSMVVVGFMWAAIQFIASKFGQPGSSTFLGMFPMYVGYFVAGYYLRIKPLKLSQKWLLIIAVFCGSMVSIGVGLLLPVLGSKSWETMYSYHNPLVIMMSLCIFQFLLNVKLPEDKKGMTLHVVHHLSPLVLGIYLIHPLWISIFKKVGINGSFITPLLGIPFISLLVFVLSSIPVVFLKRIPYLKYTVQ